MNLDIVSAEPPPIPLHVYAALAAVVLGGWQLLARKGGGVHRAVGYVWVSLMLVVSVSSFWIHTIQLVGLFSPIHVLSVFTVGSVIAAVWAARAGNLKRHKAIMTWLYALALLLTGALTLLPGRAMHAVVFC
ncbi:MAG: DUF2306 domain-containing protein [Pseudomonadota bacterium]